MIQLKKTVVGLNLLGFTTYMSCCGFEYEGAVVPKSHLGKAYVYLDTNQVFENQKLSSLLSLLSLKSGWRFDNYSPFKKNNNMKSRDFCYWLQGFFEVSGSVHIDEKQTQQIKNHLNLVFKHEIDPSIDHGNTEIQDELQNIHDNKLQSVPFPDIRLRC